MSKDAESSESPRPLKIAYLIQQFPLPTETFAVSDIAALIEQGHEVIVYTMKGRRRDEARLLRACGVPPNLAINRPRLAGALSWPLLLICRHSAFRRLFQHIAASAPSSRKVSAEAFLCMPRVLEIAELVKRSGADVVHAFWSRHVGLVLPVLKADEAPVLRSAFLGAYDLVADDFLVDLTLGAAQVAFSHASANKAHLEKKAQPGVVTEIIPRGIPLFHLGDDSPRGPFECVTASALVRSKNVEAVLRACAAARVAEPRLTLRILGEGPDRARLEQLSGDLGGADWIKFAGHVTREQLFAELGRASVFLMLSNKPSERLPNVVKEALWAGCYVITSRSEGIEELIPNPEVGQVVDAQDVDSTARVLSEALEEPAESAASRRVMARAHIAENFSSDRNMRRYVDAWRAAIQRQPQGARSPAPQWGRPHRSDVRPIRQS